MTSLFLAFALSGCDRMGETFVPTPNPDFPYIQDLGEFRVIPAEEYTASTYGDDGNQAWTADLEEARADVEGQHSVYYGGLGAPEDPAYYGGATFQFVGTGGSVCVIMDPEAIFWNQARDPKATSQSYLYQDYYADDGDIDMDIGLTAYYTGSPGVEMGDFKLPYTDEAGESHDLEFNECFQSGYLGDSVHSGRASVESCTIDTEGREGVSFTTALHTFMLPVDDSVVHFGVMVLEGKCGDIGFDIDECAIPREQSEALAEESIDCDDPDLPWTYTCLEDKYCKTVKKFNAYCEEHFDDLEPPTACIDNGLHPPADEEDETVDAGGP
jgi:hypothetical protein